MPPKKKRNYCTDKELTRVRNSRKRRQLELEELRLLRTFLQLTSPDILDEFYVLDNTPMLYANHPENPIVTYNKPIEHTPLHISEVTNTPIENNSGIDDIINEMYETYNVHLAEFDLTLFDFAPFENIN
jgi:hypothetical protein